jgi:CubicO group peptidase (beta-lactamase class C family)
MMNSSFQKVLDELMPQQHFDCASVAVIDLKNKKIEKAHWGANDTTLYDLASLTKPLTLASCFHQNPELYHNEKLLLLLNHRAGLPVGGRLSRDGWKDQILAYPIQEQSLDTYSDYSALRLQLEIEAEFKKPLYEIVSLFWELGLVHWRDIKNPFLCPITGRRHGNSIQGEVHDDNAFVLKEKLSHAGLFSNIDALAQTILNLFEQTQCQDHLGKAFAELEDSRRFVLGWDRVENPEKSLAGEGASLQTFGHLGFTGTSFWCDLQKQKGWVLLANATQSFWFERSGLRELRRELGAQAWKS